jgi:cell division protein FtsW
MKFKPLNPVLLLTQLTLLALGWLGVATASPSELTRHVMLGVISLGITWVVTQFHSRISVRFGWGFWLLTILGLLGTFFFGDRIAGVKRWIDLGFFQLQSSEFAKLALIAYLASFFIRRGTGYKLWGPVAVIGSTALLVLIAPSTSAAAFIFLLALSVMFTAGVGGFRIASIVILAAAITVPAGSFYLSKNQYVADRFQGFQNTINGTQDKTGMNFQNRQATRVLSKAGFWGHGPDAPLPHRVPANTTDFIIVPVAWASGLLGVSVVIAAFGAILVLGLRGASLVSSGYWGQAYIPSERHGSAILASGATIMLVGQAIVNLGVVLDKLPNTGMALPMMSIGGSSLIACAIAFGWIHNAYNEAKIPVPKNVAAREEALILAEEEKQLAMSSS